MNFLITLAINLCLFVSPVAQAQDAASEAPAKAAALQWLALSDAGNYAATWDQAASTLQAAVTKPKWQALMQSERAPRGATKSRQYVSATFSKSWPGLPEGVYGELQFIQTLERPPVLVETVMLQKVADGGWRVMGYWIKPR